MEAHKTLVVLYCYERAFVVRSKRIQKSVCAYIIIIYAQRSGQILLTRRAALMLQGSE